MHNKQILFLGCGKMGSAIIKNLLNNNFDHSSFLVLKPTQKNLIAKINYISDYTQLPSNYKADIIFFAFKPQNSQDLLKLLVEEKPYHDNTIFASILAGKKINFFEKILGKSAKIVRIMPNLPIEIGEGICSYYLNHNLQESEISHLLKALGKSVKLYQEEFIDASTAVAGSGPAYLFLFIKTMIDSAKKLGLTDEVAMKLVKQTVYGSAKMALESNEAIEQLILNVMSKRGTTEAALEVLMKDDRLDNLMIEAVNAACNKSKILSDKSTNDS